VSLYDTLGADVVGKHLVSVVIPLADPNAQNSCEVPRRSYHTLSLLLVTSINHSETTIAFVAQEHLPRIIAVAPKCPKLRIVVSIDDLNDSARRVATAWAKENKLELYTMQERK
jgi:hypothetical protein